jgi:hypothetical protein
MSYSACQIGPVHATPGCATGGCGGADGIAAMSVRPSGDGGTSGCTDPVDVTDAPLSEQTPCRRTHADHGLSEGFDEHGAGDRQTETVRQTARVVTSTEQTDRRTDAPMTRCANSFDSGDGGRRPLVAAKGDADGVATIRPSGDGDGDGHSGAEDVGLPLCGDTQGFP